MSKLTALVTVVVLGAAVMTAWAASIATLLFDRDLRLRRRLAAVIVPLTPIIAWRSGRKGMAVVLVGLLLAYASARFALG